LANSYDLGMQQPECLSSVEQPRQAVTSGACNTIELRIAKYQKIRDDAVARTRECIQRSKEYNAMMDRRRAEQSWQAPRVKTGSSIADGISDFLRDVDNRRRENTRVEEERRPAVQRQAPRREIGRPEPNSLKAPYFPAPSIVPATDVSPCCDVTRSFVPSRRTLTPVPLETDDHRYAHMKSWLGTVNNPGHKEGSLTLSHSLYTPSVSTQSLTGSAHSFHNRYERRARHIHSNNVEFKAQQRVLASWQEFNKNRETALRLLDQRYWEAGFEWSFTELHPEYAFPDLDVADLIHPFATAADYVRHRLTTVNGMTFANFSIVLPEQLSRQDRDLIEYFKLVHSRLDKIRAFPSKVAPVIIPQSRSEGDDTTITANTGNIVTRSDEASVSTVVRTDNSDDSVEDAFVSFDSSTVACVEPGVVEDTTTQPSTIVNRLSNLAGSLVQAGWGCVSRAFNWVKDRVWGN
jgi:hypothetical protein